MPSLEYYEGRDMELNKFLHDKIIEIFNLDSIDPDGSQRTKIDILGIKKKQKIGFSVKNVSGKNTQVHLTTIKKFCEQLEAPFIIFKKLEKWLGHNDDKIFDSWSGDKNLSKYEITHKRLKSQNINDWYKVEKWFNKMNDDESLLRLLIQSINSVEKSDYLIWINKKNKEVKILEIEQLIKYISKECKWLTMPSGTVLRCVTPENKPILWLQMKGNRTDEGYNHCPQFHIVENWPKEFVKYEFQW